MYKNCELNNAEKIEHCPKSKSVYYSFIKRKKNSSSHKLTYENPIPKKQQKDKLKSLVLEIPRSMLMLSKFKTSGLIVDICNMLEFLGSFEKNKNNTLFFSKAVTSGLCKIYKYSTPILFLNECKNLTNQANLNAFYNGIVVAVTECERLMLIPILFISRIDNIMCFSYVPKNKK
jgi:hypothetical protein